MSCVIVISSESEDETPKMAESQIKPKLTENAESTTRVEVTKELGNHKNGFKNEENAEKTNDTGIDSDVIIEQGDRSKSIKLLEEFIGLCMLLIKKENRPIEIVQFLRRRYSKATSDYKNSEEFCAVVERYIADLRRGVKREFVYINDLATHLNKHAIKQIKRPTNGVINSSSKKKAKLSEMPTTAETTEPTVDCNMPGTSSGQDGGSSTHDEDARSNVMMEQNDQRIQRYENLMKRISDEIKRYQAHELTLDEMTEENSVYVEESKLKDRFMKIFNKVCALKKVNSATGRAIERKITVASCRFPEINRKVEQYVNKSKKFPDYYSVHYLVKRANLKHNLMLSESQQQSIARTVFTEVGEAIQHRRKSDYLLNRGSYLTEKIDELTDPASIDPKLEEKLAENSKRARTQLNSVLEKYSRKQVDIESVTPVPTPVSPDPDVDCGSDPPTDDENDESEESGNHSDDVSNNNDDSKEVETILIDS